LNHIFFNKYCFYPEFNRFGLVRAFYYPHAYNKKLKTALWPEPGSLTVSVLTSVNITGNGVVVTVVGLIW
jgi:hypothetical protein